MSGAQDATNGVMSGAQDATNGVMSGARDVMNGVMSDAEAAKRPLAPAPLAPGPLAPGPLAQSNWNVVGQSPTWLPGVKPCMSGVQKLEDRLC